MKTIRASARVAALALVLAALALLLALLTPAALAKGGAIAADSRSGVVRVVVMGPFEDYYLGSAFGVGEAGKPTDIFVTNDHVVSITYLLDAEGNLTNSSDDAVQSLTVPAVNVWILKTSNAWNAATREFDTSQAIPCEVLYAPQGEYPDMAIIQAVEKPEGRVALPLLADEDTLKVGDEVYALGYPGSSDESEVGFWGERWVAGVEDVTLTSGIVSRFTTSATLGSTRVIHHNATINHGNSGGPLLDAKGAVVGINTYGLGRNLATGDVESYYSVRVQYVIDKLDELKLPYTLAKRGAAWPVVLALVLLAAAGAAGFVWVKKNGLPAALRGKGAAPGKGAKPAKSAGKAAGAAADGGLRLQGVSGVFAGRRFSVSGPLRIGRDPARSDLVYPDGTEGISGAHCVLTPAGDGLSLTDLGSSYGTFLAGGQRLTPQQPVLLKPGDRFWLGSQQELFEIAVRGGN